MPDPTAFRAQFPVFERLSYLNAGTEGPVPSRAVEAVREAMERDARDGRCGKPYIDHVMELAAELRAGYSRVLGCSPAEVALTGSTTDGVNTVLGGLSFSPGDEVLTSDEEHPGLLAPLARLARGSGVRVRVAPFASLLDAVSSETRLIACSHVSYVNGQVVDVDGLVATGVPVLLDAAQALGAVPLDVAALGVDYYAGSGQKWLCGPEGSGALYVRPDRLDALTVPWPSYASLADPHDALSSPPAEGTARLDLGFPVALRSVNALASLSVLEEAGLDWVQERAATLAAQLASELEARGFTVAPRGRSTLVSFAVDDPPAVVERLAAAGFVVRSIPLFDLVRVSVGAWTSEDELDAFVKALG